MRFNDLEATLEAITRYPEQSMVALRSALDRAGSMSRLADETGIRRQTIAMWLRGAVIPVDRNVRTILAWLVKNP